MILLAGKGATGEGDFVACGIEISEESDVEEGVAFIREAFVSAADDDALLVCRDLGFVTTEGIGYETDGFAFFHSGAEGDEWGEDAADG